MTFKQVMHAHDDDDDDCSLNPINNHPDTAVIDVDRRMHASAYFVILLYCNCIFDVRCVCACERSRCSLCAAVASL